MDPHQLMLKVDFRNAFNCIRRDKVLHSVLEKAPKLYPLVHSQYSQSTCLFFGNTFIDSAEGVQQGDPLGPLLFCLTIHDLVSNLRSEFRLFYLDDGTLGGNLNDILADIHSLEQAAGDLGLVLNHSKSEVICSDQQVRNCLLDLSPDFRLVDPEVVCLLGSPIGGPPAVDGVLSAKQRSLERMGERLKLLHSHDALCLLRNAFSLPKLLYILRTAPCFASSILVDLDRLQRVLLESICNVSLSDEAWFQASLPVKRGGLGIRSFVMLAPSAFLASAAGSSGLSLSILPSRMSCLACPHKSSALSLWQRGHTAEPPSGDSASVQRKWDSPIVEAKLSSLLEQASPNSRKRLLAASEKESGVWLNAPPISALGLRLDDESVRIAIGLRIGAPLCFPHRCVKSGSQVESSGLHGLSCMGSSGRHPRHNALNSIISRALAAIDVPSVLEPPGLFRSDGRRVDGVTIIPWEKGRALVWDATCRDTFAPSYNSLAVREAGLVAKRAEDSKKQKYGEICSTYTFVPIAVETSGVFGDEAKAFFRRLGFLSRSKTHDPLSHQKIVQRISVSIQQFNSWCILGSSNIQT